MALFGFNKQKVLANAEKYVQQGKLQNAISEYEKVLKADAKDLTVTNTVGDLYSRIGESDKATECFKTVGDAYASQGFTVKAIAMYKKISKLKPSLESLLKLAELYTQQGLFNDARAQYLQVADEFLKAGELENAVRIFQKILEMDPENVTMRVRLAEVYVRLGKKTEAWQIFSAAAESQRSKGSLTGAEEILQRMLTLDPGNTYALLMQGKNQIESGDAAGAVATLTKVPDIDSNPDGLRDLLRAYLRTGQLSEAGAARQQAAHRTQRPYSDRQLCRGIDAGWPVRKCPPGLRPARRATAGGKLQTRCSNSLHSIIGHVRENPDSLQKLLDLFHKAGETTHVSEVMELLAHASVQGGDLSRARDLYQKLAQLEPQNPLHMQNYQQVVSQLSGTTGTKLITPEEAVVLIDDLEATAPSIHQHYSDEVALAIRSALTDAELFISYNMPAKALGPLVGALPMAPNDLRLNQRLAALHTRAGRFTEAGVCCRTLQSLYSEAEHPEEATRYGELAERYEERTTAPAPITSGEEAHIFLDAAAPAGAEAAVPEFSLDEPSAEAISADAAQEEATVEEPSTGEEAAPWPVATDAADEITVEPTDSEFAVVDESSTDSAEPAAELAEASSSTSGEIDLSSEWDDSLSVETDAPAEAEITAVGDHDIADSSKVDATIDEIRFYLSNGMPEQAMAGLAKLQTVTSDQNKIDEIRAEVEAAQQAFEGEVQAEVEPVMEEVTVDDIPSFDAAADEAPVAAEEPAAEEVAVEAEPSVAEETPVAAEASAAAEPETEAPAAEATPAPGVLTEFVSDLESSLGASFLPGTVAKPSAPLKSARTAKAPAVPAAAAPTAPVLGEFVADIEASLGEDFLKAAPVPEPHAPATPARQVPAKVAASVPAATPKVSQPLAASAAAAASVTAQASPAQAAPSHITPAPVVAPTVRAQAAAPAVVHPPAAVSAPAPVVPAPAAARKRLPVWGRSRRRSGGNVWRAPARPGIWGSGG